MMKSVEVNQDLLDNEDSHNAHVAERHNGKTEHAHDDEHEGHPHEEGEPWLMSFADLILNLLLFFIVLYSISTVDEKKLMEIAEQINGEFNPPTVIKKAESDEENAEILQEIQTLMQKINQDIASDPQKKEADKVKEKMAALFRTLPGKAIENDLFEVVISGSKYFLPGRAELTDASKRAINAFATRLKPIAEDVSLYIEGHSAPAEIYGPVPEGFEWQLASQRAANVLLELKKNGLVTKNVSTSGFGAQVDLTELATTGDHSIKRDKAESGQRGDKFLRARVHLRVVREAKSP